MVGTGVEGHGDWTVRGRGKRRDAGDVSEGRSGGDRERQNKKKETEETRVNYDMETKK